MASFSALFLDRDGVLNRRTPGDYVKNPGEFVPEPGAAKAVTLLRKHFRYIVLVTNQSGIGKGLMDEADLAAVHRKMASLLAESGGRLDAVYFCPHRSDAGCGCRKPATGMAMQAKSEFPQIDFASSWIAGDSVADMLFGQALGMTTVLITGKSEEAAELDALRLDHRFPSLLEFAHFLERKHSKH